ncbi:MAG TPA: histidine phosphatase family protein [Anaerolineae bacterium]|jgi:broad specificity phosphatase PhoE
MTTTLYLIRHGRSVGNATQRIQGWLDLPLDDLGRKQARLAGVRLRHKPLAAIYTSPLQRAAETAQLIAAACGLTVNYDERLREYHMGAWTGMTAQEIQAMMPPRWDDDQYDRIGPGGETGADMRTRVSSFMSDVLARHQDQMFAVVCHGGTLGGIVSMALGMPARRRQPFSFANASITKLTYERGRWKVRSVNDRCHLRTLSGPFHELSSGE